MESPKGVCGKGPSNRKTFVLVICAPFFVALTILVILVTVLELRKEKADSYTRGKGSEDLGVKFAGFSTGDDALIYFNISDGIEVSWYHGANSQEKIQEAISGDFMMIEGDITLRWYGLPNVTDEPIMAHPPDVDSDLTLDEWIEYIIASPGKGMKLDFKNNDVVRPALEILASKGSLVQVPVWLNADVVQGPRITGQPVDPNRFLSDVDELYPDVTLSLGWTTTCCFLNYTRQHMEDMWDIVQNVSQLVTLPARAALLRDGWEEFRWLLSQDPDRLSVTVWTPSGRDDWEGASDWDMLYCRNDAEVNKIYYDLPGSKFESFQNLSITAGSPLNHFPLPARDALMVTWAHAVNSQQELEDALNSDLMFLEADVILRGQGTENQTDIPVMAHPPATDSDITLEEWLDKVMVTDKGIKLDFKFIEAMEPSLKILNQLKDNFIQPIFINADIFEGPGGSSPPVNASEFLRITNDLFPWATLSVGWKTGWSNSPDDPIYDEDHVTEMLSYVRGLDQPITFPLRAAMVRRSWEALELLLQESRGHTFTIWTSSSDEVDPEDMVFVRDHSEKVQVYFDLPQELLPPTK